MGLGCGDNSCLIQRPKGQATNGGCRCFDNITDRNERLKLKRAFLLTRTQKLSETSFKILCASLVGKSQLEIENILLPYLCEI